MKTYHEQMLENILLGMHPKEGKLLGVDCNSPVIAEQERAALIFLDLRMEGQYKLLETIREHIADMEIHPWRNSYREGAD